MAPMRSPVELNHLMTVSTTRGHYICTRSEVWPLGVNLATYEITR
jgi:hypothetical protein